MGVRSYPIPAGTALDRFSQKPGHYTDCFATEVGGRVTLAEFVEGFYTTPLFKAERLVLRCVGIRSSDHDARQLAEGTSERFAAWQMKVRTETELLMKTAGRTSSWFGIENLVDARAPETRLLFGSVVAPMRSANEDAPRMGALFSSLLGAHRLYSKLLLLSAQRRISG